MSDFVINNSSSAVVEGLQQVASSSSSVSLTIKIDTTPSHQQIVQQQQDPLTLSTSSTTSSLSGSSSITSNAPMLSYMAFKTVGRGSFGNVYLAKVVKKTAPSSSGSSLQTPQSSVHSRTGQSQHGQSLHGQSVHSYSSANTVPSVPGSVSAVNIPFKSTAGKADQEVTTEQLQQLSITSNNEQQLGQQQYLQLQQLVPLLPEEEEFVAIKKVYQNKKYKNRELETMRLLHKQPHPYIIHMRHYFTTKGKRADDIYLNLVLDFVPETLASVIQLRKARKEVLPTLLTKVYTYQMLRGLAHLHGLGLTHRDIKPHNLLIDPLRHTLKICDLGSAKAIMEHEANAAYICSRFYRAPELVLGCTQYTSAIDIWSAGCVLAEMLLGSPFFPGNSSAEQMMEIARMMGTPSRDELMAMSPPPKSPSSQASGGVGCTPPSTPTKHIEFFNHMTMPSMKPRELNKVFPFAPLGTISLLERLLKYSPSQRPRAIDACAHYNFDELRNSKTVLTAATRDDYSSPGKEESPSAAKLTNDMITNAIAHAASIGTQPIPQEMFEFTEEEMSLASTQTVNLLIHGTNAPANTSATASTSATPAANANTSSAPAIPVIGHHMVSAAPTAAPAANVVNSRRGRIIPSKVKAKKEKTDKEKEQDCVTISDPSSGIKSMSSSSMSKESSMHSSRSVSTIGASVTSSSGPIRSLDK